MRQLSDQLLMLLQLSEAKPRPESAPKPQAKSGQVWDARVHCGTLYTH